jgi:hypothetical protein
MDIGKRGLDGLEPRSMKHSGDDCGRYGVLLCIPYSSGSRYNGGVKMVLREEFCGRKIISLD